MKAGTNIGGEGLLTGVLATGVAMGDGAFFKAGIDINKPSQSKDRENQNIV
jgi:hypothetical protein